MILPFGKYEGSEVDALPENYLWWLAHHLDFGDPALQEAVRQAWDGRLAALRKRAHRLETQIFQPAKSG